MMLQLVMSMEEFQENKKLNIMKEIEENFTHSDWG